MKEQYHGFTHNDVVWILDPNRKFKHVEPAHLAESLGLIPTFIVEDADDIIQTALDTYGMHIGGDMGGKVLEDGTYQYPEDPDLHPLARCTTSGKDVFVYDYGMISFVDIKTKEAITYRFD